ncbi:MAG: hypothetical protein U1E93_13390 [Alphaproteobacteria bacterium]
MLLLAYQRPAESQLDRMGAALQMNNDGKIVIVLFLFSMPGQKGYEQPWTF